MLIRTACPHLHAPGASVPDARSIRHDRDHSRNIGTAYLIPVTNMLERLNEEIRRRAYVVRIFPNAASCCRLVRALPVETQENWLEAHRYLNMDDLKEHKKSTLREAA